jgi:cell division protein FtsN
MRQTNHRDFGGTFTGLLVGFVIGLGLALALAVYVTKVPVPFLNKTQTRSADQDAVEAKKNKDWDPNSALYGKNPAKGPEVSTSPDNNAAPNAATVPKADAPVAASTPKAATKTDVKADVKADTTDPLADLVKSKSADAAAEPFHYFVQVGAFNKADDAERQKAQLALNGWEAQLSERDQGGNLVYRVRLGPFSNRDQAEEIRKKLEDKGTSSILVKAQR